MSDHAQDPTHPLTDEEIDRIFIAGAPGTGAEQLLRGWIAKAREDGFPELAEVLENTLDEALAQIKRSNKMVVEFTGNGVMIQGLNGSLTLDPGEAIVLAGLVAGHIHGNAVAQQLFMRAFNDAVAEQ